MVIVQQLRKQLPPGCVAEPRLHSGWQVEIDVVAFEKGHARRLSGMIEGNGGTTIAAWAPARPSVAVETTLPDYDEYEVRIFDVRRGRPLVTAIEIVSPAHRDQPEHRNIFVAKRAALLQKGVAVSIVDLVTVKHFKFYFELLAVIGHSDPTMGDSRPDRYAGKRSRSPVRWRARDSCGQPRLAFVMTGCSD
jgi:hypothetical protein